jgi:hypothetical protein
MQKGFLGISPSQNTGSNKYTEGSTGSSIPEDPRGDLGPATSSDPHQGALDGPNLEGNLQECVELLRGPTDERR